MRYFTIKDQETHKNLEKLNELTSIISNVWNVCICEMQCVKCMNYNVWNVGILSNIRHFLVKHETSLFHKDLIYFMILIEFLTFFLAKWYIIDNKSGALYSQINICEPTLKKIHYQDSLKHISLEERYNFPNCV